MNTFNGRSLVSGTFKCRRDVSLTALADIAGRWLKSEPGEFYDLHIRGCTRTQHGIGFKYKLAPSDTQARFLDRMTDALKRSFGNSFAGWEISDDDSAATKTLILCHKEIAIGS